MFIFYVISKSRNKTMILFTSKLLHAYHGIILCTPLFLTWNMSSVLLCSMCTYVVSNSVQIISSYSWFEVLSAPNTNNWKYITYAISWYINPLVINYTLLQIQEWFEQFLLSIDWIIEIRQGLTYYEFYFDLF